MPSSGHTEVGLAAEPRVGGVEDGETTRLHHIAPPAEVAGPFSITGFELIDSILRMWINRSISLAAIACVMGQPIRVSAEPYDTVPASADGIGKRYMGREIAGVMGWQGAAWLERQEREREERTDLLVTALELKPGMTVGDIGAGTGFLARRMSAAVAPGGRIVAVDVQPEMIQMLKRMIVQNGLSNIEPILGAEDDVRLREGSLDVAVMVDVYHELAYPREVLASIVRALKPGGKIVFVEYRAEDARVPIKVLHKMSEAQVRREAEALSLRWVRTVETLPWQHIIVFRRTG